MLSRFNGRAYPKIGVRTDMKPLRPLLRVNVPDETGKMSRSDKRGATLPKVATTHKGSRNDILSKDNIKY